MAFQKTIEAERLIKKKKSVKGKRKGGEEEWDIPEGDVQKKGRITE